MPRTTATTILLEFNARRQILWRLTRQIAIRSRDAQILQQAYHLTRVFLIGPVEGEI